ncbi:MAG: quinone oxidoreductase [Chloroflexi bacterium]|nr:quinone oxidoreductase [Chloroflexota bacterium]
MKSIRIHSGGGPEVLQYEECPEPTLSSGQALVQLQAIGVNYTDIYTRSAPNPSALPLIPGLEGAGIVMAIGEGVTEVAVGDQVAYSGVANSYAERVAAPAWRLVKLPRGVTAEMGAAAMLQGMTAHYLSRSVFPLKSGDRALVHAGAGGVGLLLIQMAKAQGAYVFATVSTEEKARLAREAGADHVILYTQQDFEEEIKKATRGQGVNVVYDSVGKTTFDKSLNSLARRGLLALYGQSSGSAPPFSPGALARGSLFLTRPSLTDYTATRDELLQRAGDVLSWVALGKLRLRIHKRYPLREASQAHRELEGRQTTGKLLLIP